MFFGEIIEQQKPFQISGPSQIFEAFQLTNAVLDISSLRAQLYLKIKHNEILLCRLNPSIMQSNLNVLVDIKDIPALISKNGNVHVCGYFTKKSFEANQNKKPKNDELINTNKKINELSKELIKENPITEKTKKQSEKQSTRLNNNDQDYQAHSTSLRHSSRLTSRRASIQKPEEQKTQKAKEFQKISKKQQKQQKVKEKSNSLLKNGRYSLKALLQNADDGSDDSDEDFSNQGEEQQSDDDSQFQEDEAEQEEQTISKSRTRQRKQESKTVKRQKKQDVIQMEKKNQKQQAKNHQSSKQKQIISKSLRAHFQPQVQIAEQDDSDNKKQIKPEQYQQKWPETPQSQLQKSQNQIQQKISQLASKMKFPTKKPTI